MKNMKTFLSALAIAGLTAFAADEVTIKGEGKCGKCELKETDKCQNVVEVEKDGKKVKYFFADNEVSKAFHKNLCKGTAKVKATGEAKKVDGKMQFTATKIELDK
jgi:RecG-like helicase